MKRSQRGFSLIEMMAVLVILTIVMGVVFKQMISLQQRYRSEAVRTDAFSEAREFMDQFARDVHQSGYPHTRIYAAGVVGATPQAAAPNSLVAVGIVKATPTDLILEGDVDGDGVIDSVRYTMQAAANGMCPCTLQRSQIFKVNGTQPWQQPFSYNTEIQNVVNSVGLGGGGGSLVIFGQSSVATNETFVAQNDDVIFANLKTQPMFLYYDGSGNNLNPNTDISTNAGSTAIMQIRSIRFTMNLVAPTPDPQTGVKPYVSLTTTAKLPNCSIYANNSIPVVPGCQ